MRLVRCAYAVAVLDNLKHLLFASNFALEQTVHLNLVVLILEDGELRLVVQKIEELATIDFEEAHNELWVLSRNRNPEGISKDIFT